MKINTLETHDRLLQFRKQQEFNIFNGAEDCLKKNPDSLFYQNRSPYVYLFAHPRTVGLDEKIAKFNKDLQKHLENPNYKRKYRSLEDVEEKVMFWQPRLSKPKAQTNSYLFRAQSHTDIVEICWLLPPQELWSQYEEGKITENPDVVWSIDQYKNYRNKLEAPDPEDLSEERCQQIMQELISTKRFDKMMNKAYGAKPEILELFPSS